MRIKDDLMLLRNISLEQFEEAIATMKLVPGHPGLYTVCTSEPMSITHIRKRPFGMKRRISKVRIRREKKAR